MKLDGSDYLLASLAVVALAAGVYHFYFKSETKPSGTAPLTSAVVAPATSSAVTPPPPPFVFPALGSPYLHNAFKVTDKVSAGAKPDGDAAFKALSEMGVKTIISVDGAKPDLESAHKYGMRYVHLPIHYKNVKSQEGKEIAKALLEMPGPIYLHCPHGKNRAAAGVAMGCVMNGMIDQAQADTLFKTFGTGLDYVGLMSSVREAKRVSLEELKSMKVDFKETHSVEAMAEAMADISRTWDELTQLQKSNWKSLENHPELVPAEASKWLNAQFVALESTRESKVFPEPYQKMLRDAQNASKALSDILAAPKIDTQAVTGAMQRVDSACSICHKFYR